jgi:polysaccharide biosynthesis/export protein
LTKKSINLKLILVEGRVKLTYTAVALFLTTAGAWGQVIVPGQTPRVIIPIPVPQDDFTANKPSNTPTSLAGEEYLIGKDDLIEVSVFEVPELSTTSRVAASGMMSLPLVGSIEVVGHTARELERMIEGALREKYINDPHVTVFIREYASQPVSVIGAVKVPGIYQIKGQKYLLDMLAMAQGLDHNAAGKLIQVIRRVGDNTEEAQTTTIKTEDLFENGKTELNIPIKAGDVINVLQAGSVFVVGEVVKPGEFVLRQGKDITATQAVALGGGFSKDAKKHECLVIRLHRDGTKEEIPVNLTKVFEGTANDVSMLPNDILFVPANKVKAGLMRALDTTVATISGRLVYRY